MKKLATAAAAIGVSIIPYFAQTAPAAAGYVSVNMILLTWFGPGDPRSTPSQTVVGTFTGPAGVGQGSALYSCENAATIAWVGPTPTKGLEMTFVCVLNGGFVK
jgi:hypothetical protein